MQLFNTLMYDQRMAMGKIANGSYQRSPEIPFLEETTEPAMESAEISPEHSIGSRTKYGSPD